MDNDVRLLGSLVIAGCNKEMLHKLVRHLRKPYQYRLHLIYYDWLSQQWLLLPQIEQDEVEEEEDPFESWIESLGGNESGNT